MDIDEADWHDLKDKLFILRKRIKNAQEDRADMVKLLNLFIDISNGVSKVSFRRALIVTKKFLKEIGELESH